MTPAKPVDVRERLVGVLCATITPYHRDLSLNEDGIAANARWLAERGMQVLVVNGSIGEAPLLDRQERGRAVAATANASASLVVAGCSDANPRTTLTLANDAAEAGAQAVMLQPPYYYRLGPAEVLDFFRWMDVELRVPFVLYDNPATSRSELPAEVIDQVSRLRRFIGLKEASSDVLRFFNLVQDFGDRFPVIAAVEEPLLFMLAAGARACMTASAAFAPQLLADLVEAAASNPARARDLFARIHSFRRLFAAEQAAGRPAYIAYTKAAVDLMGQPAGLPRPPLAGLAEPELASLREVLARDLGLALAERA